MRNAAEEFNRALILLGSEGAIELMDNIWADLLEARDYNAEAIETLREKGLLSRVGLEHSHLEYLIRSNALKKVPTSDKEIATQAIRISGILEEAGLAGKWKKGQG